MARYWQLLVKARGDTKPAQKAMKDMRRASKNLRDAVGVDFAGIARVSALALGAGIAASVKIGVDEMLEAQKVNAQTAAVLKSTGGAANVTANQITELASSLSNMSGVDDEAIQSGQNLLLTFTNVRNAAGKNNDIFNQATATALDMSTVLKTDLRTANMQLGKALNDPVKGMSALRRVGVSFTADQQKQIKTLVASGKTMDAQKIILAELNREYGGSAAAAGKTAQGAINRLKNSYAGMSGVIVAQVMPSIAGMAERLQSLILRIQAWAQSDNGQKTLSELRNGLERAGDAAGTIINKIGDLAQKLIEHKNVVVPLIVVIVSLAATLKVLEIAIAAAKAAQAAYNVVITAGKGAITALKIAKTALIVTTKLLAAALKAVGWVVQKAAVIAYKAAIVGARIAMTAYRVATLAAAAATRVLSAAMRANPIGIVITAIFVLIGLFITLYKRNETFRKLVDSLVAKMKKFGTAAATAFRNLISKAQPVINIFNRIAKTYIRAVITYFGLLKTAGRLAWSGISKVWNKASGLFSRIKTALDFSTAWGAIEDGFRGALNGVIGLWNNLEFRIPGLPGKLKKFFGGATISTPNLPLLAEGGNIISRGAAIVGEAGPELLELPRGARVTPLGKTGNTYNITVNASQPVDTVAFMRSLRLAARMGTI